MIVQYNPTTPPQLYVQPQSLSSTSFLSFFPSSTLISIPGTCQQLVRTWPAASNSPDNTGKLSRVVLCNTYSHLTATMGLVANKNRGRFLLNFGRKTKHEAAVVWLVRNPPFRQSRTAYFVRERVYEKEELGENDLPCRFERYRWLLPRCQ